MLQFFRIVLLWRHLQRLLITELSKVIGFLITLLYTDVVGHTGGTEVIVTDDWLDLLQDFTLGIKTLLKLVRHNIL